MSGSNILELKGISKAFPGVKALDQVDFDVRKGEVLALAGENGAGKSTLMKVLTGIYHKDAGTMLFDGSEIAVSSPRDAEQLGLSIIHQELSVLQGKSVAENIFVGRMPVRNGLIDWRTIYREADELFKRLGIPMNVKRTVRGLSMAQQQMIEIARAVSYDAKLVVMDEPTSSLTAQETEILFRIIRDLKAQGRSVIFITHRLDEIFEICDRVTVLRDGQTVGTREIRDTTKKELIAMMIGREMNKQFPARDVKIGGEVLRAENISDGKKVHGVSLAVRSGEVLGIAGLVGAGRTETVRMIFGVDKKKTGKVYLHGKEVHIKSPRDSVAMGIAFVTEDRKSEGLLLAKKMRTNTVMVALDKIKKNGLLNLDEERKAAEKYVKELGVATPSIDQRVMYLSGGNQQKVVIAKWLFSDSEVIILDEPTRGIDVGAKLEIYELINELAGEGKAIIVISSDMEEILGISDRIVVMYEGKVSGTLEKDEISSERVSHYAIGGGAE